MSVTQVKQAVGNWNLRLRGNIPKRISKLFQPFGHVAIVPGAINVKEYGDNILNAARYVGVYRSRADNTDGIVIGGVGLESWLGDENGAGDIFETPVELTAVSFATAINALLPPGGAITAGTIHSIAGTYTGKHQWVTSRKALDYVTQLYGAEWRVNFNGTLDAGTVTQLYSSAPKAILVAKDDSSDLRYRALPGTATMSRENEDYTTRVVVLGEGEGETIQVGTADAVSVPYKDLHGNEMVATRVFSESATTATNVDARAELLLNQYGQPQAPAINLSTSTYDIKGTAGVGDYIYVYNPDRGFEDPANEVIWNGEPIHPVKLRVAELSWPVRAGWTVAYRDPDGVWTDLTPYVFFEGGDTNIVVGEIPRSLSGGGVTEPVGDRPNGDTSVPGVPAFIDFSSGSYQSAGIAEIKAMMRITWTTPLNTDSSTILDGAFYEIRYRVSAVIGYKVKWGHTNGLKWGQLLGNPWAYPLSDPVEDDPQWHYVRIGWGINEATLTELTPSVTYEFQIRAVDSANPPHFGAWSASSFETTTGDLFAPSTPAAPVVAGNMAAIQVVHMLGKASGGEFNLESDIARLQVHVGGSSSFFPNEDNMVGHLSANQGMMNGQIAAVGTFPITPIEQVHVKVVAVDLSGNKSSASPSATVTAQLIDNSHISSLTVSKLTAGTLTANTILGASIRTAETGARVELSQTGLIAYNQFNEQTIAIEAGSGDGTFTGRLQTGLNGRGVTIYPGNEGPGDFPTIIMFPHDTDADHYGEILTIDDGNGAITRVANRPTFSGDQDGGVLQLWQNGTIISHKRLTGEEQYLGLGWPVEEHIFFHGKWTNNLAASPTDAFFIAQINAGSSFTSWTHAYGSTMSSTMNPMYTLFRPGGIVSHILTGSTSDNFTVSWGSTGQIYIFAWCPRLGPSF